MKVFIIYPGHVFSTFDVAQGYHQALEQIPGVEVGAFAYHSALDFYRRGAKAYSEAYPDKAIPENGFIALASERVAVQLLEFKPDIVLVVAGLAFGKRGYDILRAAGVDVAILLTESPYLDKEQRDMVKAVGAVRLFTNECLSVPYLERETGVPTTYLPHAFRRDRHVPGTVEKTVDVFFHGTMWPERIELFGGIEDELDAIMRIGGIMPSMATGEPVSVEGVEGNATVTAGYQHSRIALNHHRTCIGPNLHIGTGSAWSLGPRAYEIAATGTFQLCDETRPELVDVFGDSVATYSDRADLIDQVRWYLAHDTERDEMAASALKKVQGHSYLDRARDIVVPILMEV